MENKYLENLWENQDNVKVKKKPLEIISAAKKQKTKQVIGITVMITTIVILIFYTVFVSPTTWNNFSLGLTLMIASLMVRVLLEIQSVYKKEHKLMSESTKDFHSYLVKFYNSRLILHYYVTPVCFGLYCIGFYLLLPYFKEEFSKGFYTYILISGFGSIAVILFIVYKSILKEKQFLDYLNKS